MEVRYGEQQETVAFGCGGRWSMSFRMTVVDKDTLELAVYQQRQEQALVAGHLGLTPRSLQIRAEYVERLQSPDFQSHVWQG